MSPYINPQQLMVLFLLKTTLVGFLGLTLIIWFVVFLIRLWEEKKLAPFIAYKNSEEAASDKREWNAMSAAEQASWRKRQQ